MVDLIREARDALAAALDAERARLQAEVADLIRPVVARQYVPGVDEGDGWWQPTGTPGEHWIARTGDGTLDVDGLVAALVDVLAPRVTIPGSGATPGNGDVPSLNVWVKRRHRAGCDGQVRRAATQTVDRLGRVGNGGIIANEYKCNRSCGARVLIAESVVRTLAEKASRGDLHT